jgi:hypothetical protein
MGPNRLRSGAFTGIPPPLKLNDMPKVAVLGWILLPFFIQAVLVPTPSFAQSTLLPFAGRDFVFPFQGGPALQMPLGIITSVAVDPQGNIYAADASNEIVVKVDTAGTLTVVAGNGHEGLAKDGVPARETPLRLGGIAVDGLGNLYITDGALIYIVDPSGVIRTVRTVPPSVGAYNLAVDRSNSVYWADQVHCVVSRLRSDDSLTVIAGTSTCASSADGLPAAHASLLKPTTVAVDPAGNVYISETGRIRKVDANGIISTVTSAISAAAGLAADGAGNLYVSVTTFFVCRILHRRLERRRLFGTWN